MSNTPFAQNIAQFMKEPNDEIFGKITKGFISWGLSATSKTMESYFSEINIVKKALSAYAGDEQGGIFFEYTVPRVGGRIDCGIILSGVLFIIEFKTGNTSEELTEYKEQLLQYTTDLKNYHFESYDIPLVPVLVIENAPEKIIKFHQLRNDETYNIIVINKNQLRDVLSKGLEKEKNRENIDFKNWVNSPYCPTENIIEAARELYNNHTVDEIKRSDAKGENLVITTNKLMSLIHQAKANHKKYLCMITGVPGAGKTLIGLSVATEYRNEEHNNHSVYLSGNHPLVSVLQEALTRDAVKRKKKELEESISKIKDEQLRKQFKKEHKVLKHDAKSEIKQFIQMIYLWRAEYLKGIYLSGHGDKVSIIRDEKYDYTGKGETFLPYDHVAIFDEAQRTWDKEEHSKFVRSHTTMKDFPSWSEARFLISCMDRHDDWAVVICLIGEGQDINHGEAGIGDWVESITHFPNWHVYGPKQFLETVKVPVSVKFYQDDELHLAVNLRSIRAENVSLFINALLSPNLSEASKVFSQIEKYPIVMTRNFKVAKKWIKAHAREGQRYGVIASSKAQRLKPLAIDVSHSKDMKVESWFLNDKKDIHSSFYMEDIATEFQVQGLEIDWACVAWDGDLLYKDGEWKHRQFKTTGWVNINKDDLKNYHINAYRVLLTRARRGMIILIPEGDLEDETRKKDFYDSTYQYFKQIGIPEVKL
jgi:hypothetical protein